MDLLGGSQLKSIRVLVDALEAKRTVVIGSGDAATAIEVPDHGERIKAANSLLDRWGGKPPQAITGEDGAAPIGIVILPAESNG